MLPWLLPAGLLGVVALMSLSGAWAYVLVGLWGWLVFPHVAAYVRAHSKTDGRDREADYWRTKLM